MLKKPKMMLETSEARIPKNIFLQVIIFIAVFVVSQLASGIVFFVGGVIAYAENQTEVNTLILGLYVTVFVTALSIIHCKFIEKRSLSSMGFRKKNAVSHYLSGLGVGFLLFTVVYFICVAVGAAEIYSVSFNINYGIFVVFFFGFVFQGMSEEVILRGFLMNSIGGKHSVYLAVAVSSAAFSLIHGFNDGTSVLAFVNIALFGVFMAVYMICFDNIWGVCGIHTMWNFVQGNVFGVLVSGMDVGDSIVESSFAEDMNFVNGGDFGMEGGIVTTAVIIVATVIVLVYYNKKKR